jgi:pyruvate dehydrogenase E2 component (dihydrolipoamide acetyltransferase)
MRASPRARRLAQERGLDLARIPGSGPEGLVTEADVERASAGTEEPGDLFAGRRVAERRRLEPLRRASARRTTEAWTRVPHIVQMIDVELVRLEALRGEWKRAGGPQAGITLNDAIVKAAASALAEHPELNAAVDGDELVRFAEVNAGIAVDTPRGLVVPVVARADRLPLLELSLERRRLAEKARAGGLAPADLGTSTFTVSNLGGFGIRAGTPVLNPPEAVLIFVGAAEERPVVREGALAIRPLLTLSIAYDHRVADGAQAARVTARIRELLEEPSPLLAGLASAT